MIGHLVGIISTIFATVFWPLFISTLIFGLANGFVEAAYNPCGSVISSLAAYAITQTERVASGVTTAEIYRECM